MILRTQLAMTLPQMDESISQVPKMIDSDDNTVQYVFADIC